MSGRRPRRRGARLNRRLRPYYYIAPALIFLTVLMAFPLFEGLRLSFTDTNMLNPRGGSYVGMENYAELATDEKFRRTLRITLVYTVLCVVGAVGCGLLAALGMNVMVGRVSRRLRGVVIIPWAAPIIPVALVSAWILDNELGVLNWALKAVGAIDEHVYWLGNEKTAMPAIIAVTVWRIFPFSAIVLLAALQGVPKDLYEAAQIDGASRFARFRNITVPSIMPTMSILVLFVTIWSLRRFDLIWVLTEGGPLRSTTTLVIDLYHSAFRVSELGYASAIGVVGFVLSTIVTAVYFYVQNRAERKRSHVS